MQRFTVWFQQHIRNGTLSPALDLALIPFSGAYGLIGTIRRGLYRRGVLKTRSLGCPVISVGNLTVGGTGKTPVVIALANWLHRQGKRVGVVSRGYGRDDEKQIVLVSDGNGVCVDVSRAGDEPVLIASRCPGIPVIVGADRYAAGMQLRDRFSCDALILDDGFQHLALTRDVNLLLMDAENPFGNRHLMPRGPLREPWSEIKRATALMTTGHKEDRPLDMEAQPNTPGRSHLPEATVWFRLNGFVDLRTGEHHPPDIMRGKVCVAFCGIAKPKSFSAMLEAAGVTVRELLSFPDHWRYTTEDIHKIWDSADGCSPSTVITTEKDAVKIRRQLPEHVAAYAARIELAWITGRLAIERHLMEALDRSRCSPHGNGEPGHDTMEMPEPVGKSHVDE